MQKIDRIYAIMTIDPYTGDEAIMKLVHPTDNTKEPIVLCHPDFEGMLESFPIAVRLAHKNNKEVRFFEFNNRVDLTPTD